MEIKELWVFPVPSSAIAEGGVQLIYPGGDALLLFDYYNENRNEKVFNSGILFQMAQAHRHRSEMFLSTLMDAYDRLVEIVDSDWVVEFKRINRRVADYWDIKHYAIFLKSNGLYEFLASDFTILDTKEGGLSEFHRA